MVVVLVMVLVMVVMVVLDIIPLLLIVIRVPPCLWDKNYLWGIYKNLLLLTNNEVYINLNLRCGHNYLHDLLNYFLKIIPTS